ncbi:hypothetical protein TIFTF001_035606 [Ficus carica]|uniref:Uncharacterized protein n=1 Tax=Ficus carica TaxID=3494 RepID=A0AA88E1V8_FICCA|nr:hypothetical protein TIFTF001_035606 [Ficus carica]
MPPSSTPTPTLPLLSPPAPPTPPCLRVPHSRDLPQAIPDVGFAHTFPPPPPGPRSPIWHPFRRRRGSWVASNYHRRRECRSSRCGKKIHHNRNGSRFSVDSQRSLAPLLESLAASIAKSASLGGHGSSPVGGWSEGGRRISSFFSDGNFVFFFFFECF